MSRSAHRLSRTQTRLMSISICREGRVLAPCFVFSPEDSWDTRRLSVPRECSQSLFCAREHGFFVHSRPRAAKGPHTHTPISDIPSSRSAPRPLRRSTRNSQRLRARTSRDRFRRRQRSASWARGQAQTGSAVDPRLGRLPLADDAEQCPNAPANPGTAHAHESVRKLPQPPDAEEDSGLDCVWRGGGRRWGGSPSSLVEPPRGPLGLVGAILGRYRSDLGPS